jgi:hypothetical protein
LGVAATRRRTCRRRSPDPGDRPTGLSTRLEAAESPNEGVPDVHSIHTRGVTVVTIITLVFAPVFRGHHWVWHLVGRKVETTQVACKPHDPCPAQKIVVDKVYLPAPDGTPPGPGDDPGDNEGDGHGHGGDAPGGGRDGWHGIAHAFAHGHGN